MSDHSSVPKTGEVRLEIRVPDPAPQRVPALQCVAEAKTLVITNQETHQRGLELLQRLKRLTKQAIDLFAEQKKLASDTHKAICAKEKTLVEPLDIAAKDLSSRMASYQFRAEQAAREAKRLADIEAQKRVEEEQLAEALVLENAGLKSAAAAVIEAPVPIVSTPLNVAVGAVAGMSSSRNYRAEVFDLAALVAYVAANPQWLAFLTANQTALNSHARTVKEAFEVPGVKLVSEISYTNRDPLAKFGPEESI